jgi:hypothetical protein
VAVALALITALTGDLVAAPPFVEPSAPRPATGSETVVEPPSVGPSSFETATPGPSDATTSVSRLRWQFGAATLFAFGMTPNPLIGGTAFVQAGGRGSAIWAPSVRVSASLGQSSWSADGSDAGAHARFLWGAGSLDACPIELGDPLDLGLTPCARVTAGGLDVSSTGRPSGPHREAALWIDLGGLLRGRWQVNHAIFVDVEGELFVPLDRYEFHFDDPVQTYVEPAVGYRLAAGVGWVIR